PTGRTGFNRRSAYATIAACLAAEAADIDILWSFDGPVEGLKHHRGITHTFLAAPFVALAVVAFLWALDRYWLAPRRQKRMKGTGFSPYVKSSQIEKGALAPVDSL